MDLGCFPASLASLKGDEYPEAALYSHEDGIVWPVVENPKPILAHGPVNSKKPLRGSRQG